MMCPICKEKFSVFRSQIESLSDLFQPHFALIGQLVWVKNSTSKKPMTWVSTGVTLGNRQQMRHLGSDNIDELDFEVEGNSFMCSSC